MVLTQKTWEVVAGPEGTPPTMTMWDDLERLKKMGLLKKPPETDHATGKFVVENYIVSKPRGARVLHVMEARQAPIVTTAVELTPLCQGMKSVITRHPSGTSCESLRDARDVMEGEREQGTRVCPKCMKKLGAA